MAIDRRSFLAALGAAIGTGLSPRGAFAGEPIYVSACTNANGVHHVAAFSQDGRMRFATTLPSRGHDITLRPGGRELVVFARRPGNWMAVIDPISGDVRKVVPAMPGRHFYGHGTFSDDGRLLYATENRVENGDGVLGIYDADAGYVRIGETMTNGPGPHDLTFLPDGKRLVVANGGERTEADSRDALNQGALESSLAVLRAGTGEVESHIELPRELRSLSIRHLACAPDGEVVFGCQFKGDALNVMQLVGILTLSGETIFLDIPEDDLLSLENYIGSVSLDRSSDIIAATSPLGSVVAFWDRTSRRYLGRRRMSDICGVAAAPERATFLVTSGNAGVGMTQIEGRAIERIGGDLDRWIWDNHTLSLDRA
ncbi:DUF1513 domain-containing protein [Microvirga sp. ACRRW]|uniref:DUF1513 domain-containing protein n=1 Tax=Microvirga sp. ACRRW TaxID=2918205 RepID=UPI001EF65CEB|nr:DUF1513 domain-containing protein [Microvirga sp. ACRRW]MCG7391630.1 DUF1513 domain-containing protein [Microvirga sp. ACRRW]